MSVAAAGGAAHPAFETNTAKLFLGFSGMVIGQFMAILDIQIVAASIAQIQAGIGATADEIAWVQTAYLLAEVVIMPLTAYMTKLWGTQKTFVTCCFLFVVTSVLAGFSTSIEMMILTRSLQGLAAGAMIPAVFATAFTAFPPEKRVMANIIVGLIVSLAPTIGPTLGGHLTDALNWRWLFFINVLPGLLAMWLVARWGDFDVGDPSLKRGVDWWGLIAMSVALVSLQLVLEEGAENSWFAEDYILWLTVLAALAAVFFIWRELTYSQPIINLKLFSDRNFSLGVLMTLVSGVTLFGGIFILPLYLSQIRHYSAAETGTTMLTSGIAMFVSGPITRTLLRHLEPRVAIIIGFGLCAFGFGLGSHLNDQWGFWEFAGVQALRGVGVMLAMIAAQQVTVSTLKPHQMKDASALVNLIRNIGGAVGIALMSTVLTTASRQHLTDLSALMSKSSPRAQELMNGMVGLMAERGVADPVMAGQKAFFGILQKNAAVMAFADAFTWLAGCTAVAAVLILFARSPQRARPSAV